ncbi:LIM domain-containing protein jub [Schistosoma japonicum]|nr:LIM domain-containing protein jub [Schistosoma japonicum]
MNSLSRSIESLPSTRNTPCLQQNSLNNTMMLNDNLHIVTPESSGYTSGNESINGNHHSTTTLGLSPRIFGNCTECGLRIVNLTDACYAMGYLYHNSCFICCCCKPKYCGFQQTVEKCFACGHIIAETILLAIGNTYHPGCFRCCICTKCLDGIPFTIDANNLIYCLPDYHLVNGPLCAVCGLVIMPDDSSNEVRRVVALGKEFHIDCYRCIDCKRSLGDEPDKRCYPLTEPDPGTPGHIWQDFKYLPVNMGPCSLEPSQAFVWVYYMDDTNHTNINLWSGMDTILNSMGSGFSSSGKNPFLLGSLNYLIHADSVPWPSKDVGKLTYKAIEISVDIYNVTSYKIMGKRLLIPVTCGLHNNNGFALNVTGLIWSEFLSQTPMGDLFIQSELVIKQTQALKLHGMNLVETDNYMRPILNANTIRYNLITTSELNNAIYDVTDRNCAFNKAGISVDRSQRGL